MNTAANKYMSMEVGVAGQKGVVVLTSRHEIVEDVDIVAVVDCSLSMEGPKLDMVQMTLHALVEAATATSSLTIVRFSDDAEIVCEATPVRDCHEAIEKLEATDSTNLLAGLGLGIQSLVGSTKKDRRRAFFAFTDGCVNRGVTKTGELIAQFKRMWQGCDDVHLWMTSLGSDSDYNLMRGLANVVQTKSMFNHIMDHDYGEFAGTVGALVATVQSSINGTIVINDHKTTTNFCLPRDAANCYLFDVITQPISVKVDSDECALSLKFDPSSSSTTKFDAAQLIQIVTVKDQCCVAAAKEHDDVDALKSLLAGLPVISLDDKAEYAKIVRDQYAVMQQSIDNLKSIIDNYNDREKLCCLSSQMLSLKRQSTSSYTATVSKKFRKQVTV